jgi:ribonuclease D
MTPTADRPPPLYVTTPEGLARLAERLAGEPRVALDTEANSLHAFRERVCVVQTSVPDLDAIVDPLAVPDLSPLREALARPGLEVVLHGGDYDVSILSRDHGFAFGTVFDTMVAATLLGDERVGLAALLESAFGVRLTKKWQTSDWAARPLPPEKIAYLRDDTAHLLALRRLLGTRLAEADLLEEADIEFRRLAARRGTPFGDDPEGWRRLRGADRLDAAGRAVLSAAWRWRDERAKRHDVPRFRVLPNETLLDLASRLPRDASGLAALPGTASVVRMGDTDSLLAAVEEGLEAAERGDAPPPATRARPGAAESARIDRARKREERLRRWRGEEAVRRGVPNAVVLPNPGLEAIAEGAPATVADLAALPDVGPKRAARYGEAILAVLAAGPPPPRA